MKNALYFKNAIFQCDMLDSIQVYRFFSLKNRIKKFPLES